MKKLLSMIRFVLIALFVPVAMGQPSDWGVPVTVTDGNGATHVIKFDYVGSSLDLYDGNERIDTIDVGNMTAEQLAAAAKVQFNATIRARFGINRDPLNHPVDGEYFKALLAALCWSDESSQFVDPKVTP